MRRLANFLLIGAILFSYASTLYAPWVKGYYRKNGTYVSGYWRSSPNKYKWDNKNFDKGDSPYLTDWYNQSWFSNKKSYEQTKRMDDYQKQSEPVQVRGYYRKNGTYVNPYTRSRPQKQYDWNNPYELDSYNDYEDDYENDYENDYDLDWLEDYEFDFDE